MNELLLQFSHGLNGLGIRGISVGGILIGFLVEKKSATGEPIGFVFRSKDGLDGSIIFSDINEFKEYILENISVHISANNLFSTCPY